MIPMDPDPRLTDCGELAYKRMSRVNFVVTVGTDQKQMPYVWLSEQVFDQIERSCVAPLQIVQEQGERVLRPRENAKETSEHKLEASLRVLWRKIRDRRLLSDDALEFGNEVHNKLPV